MPSFFFSRLHYRQSGLVKSVSCPRFRLDRLVCVGESMGASRFGGAAAPIRAFCCPGRRQRGAPRRADTGPFARHAGRTSVSTYQVSFSKAVRRGAEHV
jgi:hypothetical protein